MACGATQRTGRENGVHLDVIRGNLMNAFRGSSGNLKQSGDSAQEISIQYTDVTHITLGNLGFRTPIDIIVFNPPYVGTTSLKR